MQRLFGSTREKLFRHGLGDGSARGLNPQAPPRQLACHIGDDGAIWRGNEAQQARPGQNLARDNIAAGIIVPLIARTARMRLPAM
jgi:hypothetical protein